jgi:hypothetical protein
MPRIKPKSEEDRELTVYVEKSYTTKTVSGDFVKVSVGATLPLNPSSGTKAAVKLSIEQACSIVDAALFTEVEKILGE